MIDISNQIDEILENFYRILCFYLKKRKKYETSELNFEIYLILIWYIQPKLKKKRPQYME